MKKARKGQGNIENLTVRDVPRSLRAGSLTSGVEWSYLPRKASTWVYASATISSKPAARISSIICGTETVGSVVPVSTSPL